MLPQVSNHIVKPPQKKPRILIAQVKKPPVKQPQTKSEQPKRQPNLQSKPEQPKAATKAFKLPPIIEPPKVSKLHSELKVLHQFHCS